MKTTKNLTIMSLVTFFTVLFLFSVNVAQAAETSYRMQFSNISVKYDSTLLNYTFDNLYFSKQYSFTTGLNKVAFDEKGYLWIKTNVSEIYCICFNDYEKDTPDVFKSNSKRIINKETFTVGSFMSLNLYLYYFDTLTDIPVEISNETSNNDNTIVNIDLNTIFEPTAEPTSAPTTVPTVVATEVPTTVPDLVAVESTPVASDVKDVVSTVPVTNEQQIAQQQTQTAVATTQPSSLTYDEVLTLIQQQTASVVASVSTTTPTVNPVVQATAKPKATAKSKTTKKVKKTKKKTKVKKKMTNNKEENNFTSLEFSEIVKFNKKKNTLTLAKTKKSVIDNVKEFGYTIKGTTVFRRDSSLYMIKNNRVKLVKKNVIAFIYDFENEKTVTKYVINKNGKPTSVKINF